MKTHPASIQTKLSHMSSFRSCFPEQLTKSVLTSVFPGLPALTPVLWEELPISPDVPEVTMLLPLTTWRRDVRRSGDWPTVLWELQDSKRLLLTVVGCKQPTHKGWAGAPPLPVPGEAVEGREGHLVGEGDEGQVHRGGGEL